MKVMKNGGKKNMQVSCLFLVMFIYLFILFQFYLVGCNNCQMYFFDNIIYVRVSFNRCSYILFLYCRVVILNIEKFFFSW